MVARSITRPSQLSKRLTPFIFDAKYERDSKAHDPTVFSGLFISRLETDELLVRTARVGMRRLRTRPVRLPDLLDLKRGVNFQDDRPVRDSRSR